MINMTASSSKTTRPPKTKTAEVSFVRNSCFILLYALAFIFILGLGLMSSIPTFSDSKSTAVVDGLKRDDANADTLRDGSYNLRQWTKPEEEKEEEEGADDGIQLGGAADTQEVVDGADARDAKQDEEKQTAEETAGSVEEQQVKEEASEQKDHINISNNGNNDRSDEMYEKNIAQMQKKIDEKKKEINSLKQKLSSNSELETMLLSGLAQSSSSEKDEVIKLLIEQYTAGSSPDETEDRLVSAFEAIGYKHTDGRPIRINGYPYLYVGSVGASLNENAIRARNITHVVNWSSTARCNVWGDINYLCIYGLRERSDMSRQIEKLRDAVEFVEGARLSGGSIMSHCWYGRNRSVTLLVAYLMTYAGMDAHEATSLISETRPTADPYYDALALYKERYLDKNL